jgi:nucleoside-diphosphate-sugar epimerase
MSVLEFARMVNRLTGNRAGVVHRPLPADDPHIRQPDIGRAQAVLGWQPGITLEEGLTRTIEYYRSRV